MTLKRFLPAAALDRFYEAVGFDLRHHAFMVCRRGSQTYGTATAVSDDDFFAVVHPPASRLLGLSEFDNWKHQDGDLDVVVYSIRKYFSLLLKNNPSALETLWYRPNDYCQVDTSMAFHTLQLKRDMFSSLHAYHSFSGYAYAQLRRMEAGAVNARMGDKRKQLVAKFGYDTKNAAHLVRLYRMGAEFVETGQLTVYRPDRAELLAIRNGEWTLERVKEEAERLHEKMRQAKESSPLPAEPALERAERFLVSYQLDHLVTARAKISWVSA